MSDKLIIETAFGQLDDDQLKTLRDGIKEMSVHFTRVESERLALKDIIDSVFDETKIPKKIIRRIAKVYHKQIFAEVIVEDTEFQALYETVVSKKDA